MKLDSAYQIGKTHDVCEDYALVNNKENSVPFAVVSDGCSSSPNTDVGSRILTLSAVEQMESIINETEDLGDFDGNVCISKARDIAKSLNLSPRSVDATLLMAVVTDRVQINMLGDGVVAIGLDNGDIFTVSLEYRRGYPFYLSYLPESCANFQAWRANLSDKIIKTAIISKGKAVREEAFSISGEYFNRKKDKKKPTIYIDGGTYNTSIIVTLNNLKWITLMSDGVQSFYRTENAGTSLTNVDIDYKEVVIEALSFKNFNGKFMQRRLNRFLKFCDKNNWHHADDISFGAIYFESN